MDVKIDNHAGIIASSGLNGLISNNTDGITPNM